MNTKTWGGRHSVVALLASFVIKVDLLAKLLKWFQDLKEICYSLMLFVAFD